MRSCSQILTNAARDWFSILNLNFIASFPDFADKFSASFASYKHIRKTAALLIQMHQRLNETLHNFMTRFNNERLRILNLLITSIVSALTYAIRLKHLRCLSQRLLPSQQSTYLPELRNTLIWRKLCS